ncbi:MAG: YraN family protein [Deltaproteobacteria bacterium]|nr:YraN family protein [Deltaproteobacteria bacterium]MBW2063303.1 YraN family protein [Deltaproteobacteria bacterium]
MTKERQALGRLGEELALRRVKSLGYQCIERNYRCPLGELDLIARDRDTLVFIEIRTRRGESTSHAKESIDKRKRRTLSKVALYYMKEKDCFGTQSRFDVVVVGIVGGRGEIEIIQNAFDLEY